MTSRKAAIGDQVYVPFWTVLDLLDATPPEPFIRAKIIATGPRNFNSPTGPVQFDSCDLELKPQLIAPGVPLSYIIHPGELKAWADHIAKWFSDYADKQISTHQLDKTAGIGTG